MMTNAQLQTQSEPLDCLLLYCGDIHPVMFLHQMDSLISGNLSILIFDFDATEHF